MTWLLFLLVVVGVSAVFFWDYRRKAARREAASKERFERIFKAKGATDVTPQASPAAAPFREAHVTPKPPASLPAFHVRDRFLGQPQTLAYLLLKTALPDLQIFANVTLASVVNVPQKDGPDREQQLRRLSQCRLDFVVCSRDMRILAVVDVDDPENRDAGMQRYKADCLTAAGVRFVLINPLALPSREAMRGLVCGGPDASRK